ncbi:hypothetical protein OHA84_37060 [Streptomyces sp. NBC_00513]|uniref:hypothetical protein n=1 Tax=unclassified Streptomyces TaxID=2593676 RepID=UPI00225036F8|nr:hypothetical protein [Streptomyces sp. NBC_00424]MCX5078617.1 hypothetical protein [Streptomyces sp. NBC_00424]WUD39062.1 hypothetical protein OHA84_00240 [Streptomyces sp. NBC_00513]WUD45667.1 hypothetical protein OHA84_37060 [Streptomyces sp. NBC_00513]
MVIILSSAGTGAASALPATDAPKPLPSGASLSVQPGDRVAVSTPARVSADARNGVRVTSGAFAKDGMLRMQNTVVTAVVTISCAATAGPHEVFLKPPADEQEESGGSRLWGSVQVAAADGQAREECTRRTAQAPEESQEEDWGRDAPWPQTPWHVRTVQAGARIAAQDNTHTAYDGQVKLTSSGFTAPVVMRGDKMATATAAIRCDAQPGLYTVEWKEAGKSQKVWARYRVTQAAPDCMDAEAQPQAGGSASRAPWLAGGAGTLLALTLGTSLWLRRRRAKSS